jgi:SPOR domain
MTESQDRRISELYRQSSQELPPPHLDHAVMDMARKSTRRRVFSPFGNHWIAGAATVGVVVISVLVMLTLPQVADRPAPESDLIAPSRDLPTTEKKKPSTPGSVLSGRREGDEGSQRAPAAPPTGLGSYNVSPEKEVIVPAQKSQPRAQRRSAAREEAAGSASPAPAGQYYLEAGAFRDRQQADKLKRQLAGLGFKCDIQEQRSGGEDVLYQVRVGPYEDPVGLETSRLELKEMGVEARMLTSPE